MAFGYGISSIFYAYDIKWYYSFYIQCATMFFVGAIFGFIPSEIFSHEHEALIEKHEETLINA
jgi:hypothetical protein